MGCRSRFSLTCGTGSTRSNEPRTIAWRRSRRVPRPPRASAPRWPLLLMRSRGSTPSSPTRSAASRGCCKLGRPSGASRGSARCAGARRRRQERLQPLRRPAPEWPGVPSTEYRAPSSYPASGFGLQGVAKPVGERSERLRRPSIRAFGVLAYLVGLAHSLHRRRAQANTTRRRVYIEDHDLHVVADVERLLHVHFSRHAALAQRDEAFDARFELHKRPEVSNARHASPAKLAGLIRLAGSRPRIGGELLEAE